MKAVAYKRILRPGGVYVLVGGSTARLFQRMFLGPLISLSGDLKMEVLISKPKEDDLLTLRDLVEARKIKPVIGQRFPLGEVPDSIRSLEEGRAAGKVVIAVR